MLLTQTISSSAQVNVPDLEAIRADLEAAKTSFQQLLNSLTEAELERPCAVSKWTVKEVMCHLVLHSEQAVPLMVKQARKGKGMPKFLETRFGHWLNYKMAVWAARKATRDSLVRRYDKAYESLLEVLAGVRDEEWENPTAYPDGRPLTMETVFHVPTEHFELHAGWIRQTVDTA